MPFQRNGFYNNLNVYRNHCNSYYIPIEALNTGIGFCISDS